jgi:membrane protease YdiL (CAAX protease family)
MPIIFSCLFFLFIWTYHHVIFPLILRKARQKHPIKQPIAPRWKSYVGGIFMTSSLAGFALLVALLNRIPVLGSTHIDLKIFLLASGFLVLNLGVAQVNWKCRSTAWKKSMSYILPRTAPELLSWVFVSLVAGIGEEIVYRAVFFKLFYQMMGNYWGAGAISATFFALAHYRHGVIYMVELFFVALGLQWIVKISGGLYAVIAIHFLNNFSNGVFYGALAKTELVGESSEIL